MTTLYVTMVADRHTDTEPFLFETPAEAIAYARQAVQDNARHPDSIEEHEPPEGWMFYATYSSEGDSVWVLAKDVGVS